MMNKIPPQLIQLMRGGNPQQMALNMLQKMQNPIAQNVVDLANNGQYGSIKQVAENLCKSRGINPEELINELKQYM